VQSIVSNDEVYYCSGRDIQDNLAVLDILPGHFHPGLISAD
jgi:hypothetical protein